MIHPSVSVVIVNFNGRHLLESCLPATLGEVAQLEGEIILVDNASSDGSLTYVQTTFPQILLVENPRNEGFAGGCNAGVRVAKADVVVLLNNDAVPQPGWLRRLLDALEPANVAVAASVVQEARYPGAYELGTGSISVIGHPIPNVDHDPARPFYATGCSLAFKKPIFPEPFDPIYFAYFEDALLSWRAHLRGLLVARAVESKVTHLGSATALQQPTLAAYYWERNRILTLLLCYQRATLVKLIPLFIFDGFVRTAEDVWHTVSRRRGAALTLRRWIISARALAWLVGHRSDVASSRRTIQQERKRGDQEIIRMLSGKIFDDHVPTWAHTIANHITLAYCRVAGLRTAEQS